jgi:hypothetical protein
LPRTQRSGKNVTGNAGCRNFRTLLVRKNCPPRAPARRNPKPAIQIHLISHRWLRSSDPSRCSADFQAGLTQPRFEKEAGAPSDSGPPNQRNPTLPAKRKPEAPGVIASANIKRKNCAPARLNSAPFFHQAYSAFKRGPGLATRPLNSDP